MELSVLHVLSFSISLLLVRERGNENSTTRQACREGAPELLLNLVLAWIVWTRGHDHIPDSSRATVGIAAVAYRVQFERLDKGRLQCLTSKQHNNVLSRPYSWLYFRT